MSQLPRTQKIQSKSKDASLSAMGGKRNRQCLPVEPSVTGQYLNRWEASLLASSALYDNRKLAPRKGVGANRYIVVEKSRL